MDFSPKCNDCYIDNITTFFFKSFTLWYLLLIIALYYQIKTSIDNITIKLFSCFEFKN